MKRLKYILLVVMKSLFVSGQIINIPDVNFKYALVQSSINNSIAYDCATSSYYKVDINGNGEIEENEALAVCGLRVSFFNINDLTGIEKFTNLIGLNCDNNNLSDLDLSQLIHLERFGCWQNNLASLDLSTLQNLKVVSFQNNQISNINFSNNPQLEKVFCSNNLLSSLDFSNNLLFNELDCYSNPNLTTVKINNGAMQLFGTQTYYNQCWNNLPNLTTICADANEIDNLYNYFNSCGISTSGINVSSSCTLGVVQNSLLENLTISPNPSNNVFNITFGNVLKNTTTIEVYNMLGQKIFAQSVTDKDAYIFDASNLPTATYLLKIINQEAVFFKKILKN